MTAKQQLSSNDKPATLGIFVKHPVPGQVKTRLAAEIGVERATDIYAAFVADLADRFRETADRRILCFSPNEPTAEKYFHEIAGEDYELWPQPALPLGGRMASFFNDHLNSKGDRVILIGSDSPTLPIGFVERAFEQLDESDCVLGPATDGGYYLVGQYGKSRPIFHDIEWSSPRVFEQTTERISEIGATLSLLSPWYDIDTIDDLYLLQGHINLLKHAEISINLDHTSRVLSKDFGENANPL